MTPAQVPGLIPTTTGDRLRKLAARVSAGHVIVEIGAYQGRSTCYLATGSAEGNRVPVISIDPWDSGTLPGPTRRGVYYLVPETEQAYQRHLAACGIAHLVRPVKGSSWDAPLPAEPIGLLWIDGAHDYATVAGDLRRWTPLVSSGGTVVLDDYRAHSRGVDRAVRQFAREQGGRWTWDLIQRPLAVGRRR